MSLDRPVLITGTPRAGKSLVAKIIANAPEFFWLSEPKEIWDIGLGRRGHDRRTADEVTPELRGAIVEQCCKYLHQSGRPRYVEELARHALRIPFIFSVLPDVRLILVVRHPRLAVPEMIRGWKYRDTVRRKMRRRRRFQLRTTPFLFWRFFLNYIRVRARGRRATWGPTPPGLTEFARSHTTAEIAAYHWATLYTIALDDLESAPSSQWMIVNYENLLGNLRNEVERIADFSEVEDHETLVRAAESVIDPDWSPTDPPPEPTSAEWQSIREIVGPVQKRLGFDSWTETNGENRHPAVGASTR